MSTDGLGHASIHLFKQIESDFEALAQLIERAMEGLTANGAGNADIERLVRARKTAKQGVNLARSKASRGRMGRPKPVRGGGD